MPSLLHRNIPVLLAFALALPACGSGGSSGEDGAPDGGSGGADGGAEEEGLRTIDSCTTSIADDVPAFFRTYFRCVTITKSGASLVLTTEDLPPHRTAYYPDSDPNHEAWDPRGGQYHQNPNHLKAQHFSMTVPLEPVSRGLTVTSDMVDHVAQTNPNEYRMGPVGVALDSVEIFNDQAAPGDDIAREQFTFDTFDGHPAPTGEYHYHSASPGPFAVATKAGADGVELVGLMCDGTLVLGCTELDGSPAPSSGLDAQNGHVSDLVDLAGTKHFSARYHTHVCPRLYPAHPYSPEIQFYATCNGR